MERACKMEEIMTSKLISAALGSALVWIASPALSQNVPESDLATPTKLSAPSLMVQRTTDFEKYQDLFTPADDRPRLPVPEAWKAREPAPKRARLSPRSIPSQARAQPPARFHPPPQSIVFDSPTFTKDSILLTQNDMLIPDEPPPAQMTTPPPGEDATPAPMMTNTPNVVGLKPFTPEANYMSLAGLLRYQTYATTGVWLSHQDALAAVDAQLNAATR